MQSDPLLEHSSPGNPPTPLRVVVAAAPDRRGPWSQALAALGHQTCEASTGAQLAEQCRLLRPDLAVADPDLPGLTEAAAPGEPDGDGRVPLLLVGARPDLAAVVRLEGWDLAGYLTEPVGAAAWAPALAVAVRSFAKHQALRRELAGLRRLLESRREVERAKGAVMRRLGVGEEEAHRLVQRLASKSNRKMAELARQILKADEVFRELEAS